MEEYVVELLSQNLDPKDQAQEYVEAAKQLLAEAREELDKNAIRQAAEKLWGATALAVKAYALWREGRRLASHGELWSYTLTLKRELGSWVHDVWMNAIGMHVCFHEGWCTRDDVEYALNKITQLVKAVTEKIRRVHHARQDESSPAQEE